MKNVLTKIGYMAFGCLLTLIGYHFGNVDNNSADAQIVKKAVKTVDELRCRKLVIVDDSDTPHVILDREGIQVRNAMGDVRATIFVDEEDDSGIVLVLGTGPSRGAAVLLDVDDNGGNISLWNKLIDTLYFKQSLRIKGTE